MENRSRVQEIKQRFEGVTSQTHTSNVSKQNSLKPPLAIKPNYLVNNSEPTTKCIIKRSHAFRSDKSKVKPYLVAKDTDAIKKQFRRDEKLPPINNKFQNTSVTSSLLTDTLKKALKAPLPSGPAPKKPPRTFAHNIDGPSKNTSSNKMELEEKLKDFVHESESEQNSQPHNNNNGSEKSNQPLETGRITKEKVLAFIKNFENAANKNKKVQNNNNNNNNGHIYDSPNDSTDQSDNSNSVHVYSEPYIPHVKEQDRAKKIDSLHYMFQM